MSPTNHFNGEEVTPWTLAQIYDDLVSKTDIARALNVKVTLVTSWMIRRPEIKSPEPIKRIAHVDIYSLQEWKDWHRRWIDNHPKHVNVRQVRPHGHGENFWSAFDIRD